MRMSFLTSVVDGTDFLDQMLASLVAQTFKDFELVLVIDKPDKLKIESGLIDIAEGYRKHFPITVIKNQKRLGLTASLNLAADAAIADVLVRIDADDLCLPDRAATIISYFESGFNFVGNATILKNEHGDTVGKYPKHLLSHKKAHFMLTRFRRVAAHSGFAFSRDLFVRLGGYDNHYQFSQDFDFALRAIEATSSMDFVVLNTPLSVVTLHPKSISQSFNRKTQLIYQVEALLRHNYRAANNGIETVQKDIAKMITSQHLWQYIRKSQEFKARMRSASRLLMILSWFTNPKSWALVLIERQLLRRMVKNIQLR